MGSRSRPSSPGSRHSWRFASLRSSPGLASFPRPVAGKYIPHPASLDDRRTPDDERCMAGHSKWKNIKHYKAATDAKRGVLFTKLIREIMMAAKLGGGDPSANARLRLAIDAGRSKSLPKENIERAIKKGTGELAADSIQEVTYEGYGPGGVALIIDAMTDNPTRTVADVRHKMSRAGGNLGTPGSVAFMFEKKGVLQIDAS